MKTSKELHRGSDINIRYENIEYSSNLSKYVYVKFNYFLQFEYFVGIIVIWFKFSSKRFNLISNFARNEIFWYENESKIDTARVLPISYAELSLYGEGNEQQLCVGDWSTTCCHWITPPAPSLLDRYNLVFRWSAYRISNLNVSLFQYIKQYIKQITEINGLKKRLHCKKHWWVIGARSPDCVGFLVYFFIKSEKYIWVS